MSQEWQDSPAGEGTPATRRQRWSTESGEGQRATTAGRARGQGTTGAGGRTTRGQGDQIWQNRLQQMVHDSEQNLPDGALTAGYKADPKEIISLLRRAQASEWTSFLQYWHHYFMASDLISKEIKDVFQEHAKDEYHHARKLGERIQQIGGVPCDNPEEIIRLTPTPYESNHDVRSMMEADLVGERQTIDFYDEIIRTCGFDDNVTRHMMEDIVAEEAEHADEFATLLYAYDATTGEQIESMSDELQQIARQTAPPRTQAAGQGQARRTA
jgi:bacterioferritin